MRLKAERSLNRRRSRRVSSELGDHKSFLQFGPNVEAIKGSWA